MHDKNRSLTDLDKHALIHPYTNLANQQRTGPLVIERGDGIHVIDENGK
ncbi:aspartate aminotransferase family protein, partial [Mesorhizobium sp. M0293]